MIEIDAKGKQHIHFFPHRILSLYPDARGGLWVGVLGYGLYYIEKGNFSIPSVRSLPGLSVSNITEDREGHIWCTTLEKGVYRCQQPKIIFYNNFDGLRRRMDYLSNDNELFIASSRFSELMTIDQQHRTNRITLNGKSAEVITVAKTIDNQFFIGHKERLYAGYLTNNSIELKQRKDFPGLNFLQFKERFGLIYGIGYSRIFYYRKGKFVPIINRLEGTPRCFLPIDSNRFLVVSFDRVQLYESTNGVEKVKTIPRTPESIVKLFYAKKSKRVFALTKGSGLFEWKNNQFVSCNRTLRISIDVLNDGLEDERGNVWFATNEGLIKCVWNGKAFGKAKVFNELHGLPSKVCDKLAVNGDEMAVSTTEGLITFPLNHSLQSSKIAVHDGDKVIYVHATSILSFEAIGRYTKLTTLEDGHFLMAKNLKLLEEEVANVKGFIRINRSVLINSAFIVEYSKSEPFTVVLKNGAYFELSRRKRQEILKELKSKHE